MIHQFINNGYPIVLDVHSGAVHVVDELCYQVLQALAQMQTDWAKSQMLKEEVIHHIADKLAAYNRAEIQEVLLEIATLTEAGKLFSKDSFAPLQVQMGSRETVVKALCLHIAHDCNLACKYCFAEEGEYHGRRALMSFSVGKKALDFLLTHSGQRKNLEVDFFGGEPLMNWQVVKELVAYGRSKESEYDKKFRFTMTTNGVLLSPEIEAFLNEEMDNVVLSLDGRQKVNDAMRPFRGDKGSYELVVPKFQRLARSRENKKYFIRGTFTNRNLDFVQDILHYYDLGFDQISIEPVVGEEADDYSIRQEDLPQIFAQYDELARMMLEREKAGKGFQFFHFMLDLEGGPCVFKRVSGCGAGTEYIAVTPWGDLYPCHQFVGDEDFLLGDVDRGIVKPELVEQFRGVNVYSKEACTDCFARYYCSGGCMANAYHFQEDIRGVYEIGCEMQRKRVECAIMLNVARSLNESNEVEKERIEE